MKRYIDVERLCEWLNNLQSGFTKEELVFRDELIEHLQGNNGIVNVLPCADVVEVVRCKDCFFSHKDDNYRLGYACEKPLYHPLVGEKPHRKLMQDCDFCSHGVRRPPERSDAE